MLMRTTSVLAHKSWPGLRLLRCGLSKKLSIYGKYPYLTMIQNGRTISSDIIHDLMSSLSTFHEDGQNTFTERKRMQVNENATKTGEAEADNYYQNVRNPIEEAKINAIENSINIDNIDALSKEDALEILAIMHGAPPLYQPTPACRCDMCNRALLQSLSTPRLH